MSPYLDHQHRCWMKPNAASWMRPDAKRWLQPNQQVWQWPGRNEQKYNPEELRLPLGNPHGGRWTTVSSGGGISIAVPSGSTTSESDELSDFSNEILTGLGQTLNDLRDQLARIRFAGDIPTGDSPPEIPKEKPPKSWQRTELLTSVARTVAAGVLLDTLAVQLPWLLTQQALIGSYNDPPKSLEELQSAVDTWRAGTDKHHIVEQTSAEEDGFREASLTARKIWFGFHD